jgi:hypothetical protein
MNNGMFSPSVGSVEDRLAHIESTLPNLARLQEQTMCFEKLEKLALDLDQAVRQGGSIQAVLDNFAKDYNDNMKKLAQQHSSFFDFMTQMSAKSSSSDDKLENLKSFVKKEFDNVIAFKISQESKLDQAKSQFASSARVNELNEMIAVMTVQLNAFKAEIICIKKDMDSLKQKQTVLEANVEACKRNQDSIASIVSDVAKQLEDYKIQSKKLLKDLANDLNLLIGEAKEHLETKIDSLPKPQNIDIDAVKHDILQRTEPSQIEAKNANLRSSNNESKIVLLEKKVEQLYLLLNKYELSK